MRRLTPAADTVTHRNSVYGATAPAVRFVIGCLGHPRTSTSGVYFYEERRRAPF